MVDVIRIRVAMCRIPHAFISMGSIYTHMYTYTGAELSIDSLYNFGKRAREQGHENSLLNIYSPRVYIYIYSVEYMQIGGVVL